MEIKLGFLILQTIFVKPVLYSLT